MLARSEAALLAPITIAPMLIWSGDVAGAQRLRQIGAAAGCTVLVLAPWVVPNLVRFEEPVFLSTNDGLTLYGANCYPDMYEGGGLGLWTLTCAFTEDISGLDQSEVSSLLPGAGVRDHRRSHRSAAGGGGGAGRSGVELLSS